MLFESVCCYVFCVAMATEASCSRCTGTEFMTRLHEQLKYFVVKKMSTDRLWQGVRVYLSGHEVGL